MRSVTLTCVFICFILFAGTSPTAFAETLPLSSDSPVGNARALIERGQFTEALAVLRPLAPNHPDRTDVLFLVGLAALGVAQRPETPASNRTGLLDEAIAAFHAILIDWPELARVRLELARAFFLKGEDALSRKHFDRVLAGEPPSAIVANVQRFIEAMRARRRWSGYFGATLAPDSNINAASDAGTIYVYGLPFRRDADSGTRTGLGVVLWGGGEYQHPLSHRLRLRTGTNITLREYGGWDFDQTALSVYAGPRWLVGRSTETSVLGSVRRRWAASQQYSREQGARVEAAHRFSGRLVGHGWVSWHQRDFD